MIVRENIEFQRGKDPKETMEIGLDAQMIQKYGERRWKNFKRMNDLSHISQNFEWVSEIQTNEEDPYFNIESYFYYTDSEDGGKIPIQFVIILEEDGIIGKEIPTRNTEHLRNVIDFVEFTEAFYEDDEWEGLFESVNFQRGKDPKVSMGLGHVDWDNLKAGDILQATTLVGIESSGAVVFSGNWDRLSRGEYVLITQIKRDPEEKILEIDGEKSMDLGRLLRGEYNQEVYFWATIRRLKTRLRIVQRNEMNESVSFERGINPKEAMGIGRIVLIHGDRGHGTYEAQLIKPYQGSNKLPDEEIWEVKILKKGEFLDGYRTFATKYPDNVVDYDGVTGRRYWGEIDPFVGNPPFESVQFERGKDPMKTMEIGQIGNPLKVYNVGVEVMVHPYSMISGNPDKRMKKIPKIRPIGDGNIDSNLRKMEAGIPDGQMPRYLHQYRFLMADDSGNGFVWHPLEDLVGNYIEVRGKTYDLRNLDPHMEVISWNDDPINEYNFERGKDPKDSIEIGRKHAAVDLKSKMEEITYPIEDVDAPGSYRSSDEIIFQIDGKNFEEHDPIVYQFTLTRPAENPKLGVLALWGTPAYGQKYAPPHIGTLSRTVYWDTVMDNLINQMRDTAINLIREQNQKKNKR
jgi:hypothetical protein